MRFVRALVALAVVLAPSVARAEPPRPAQSASRAAHPGRTAHVQKSEPRASKATGPCLQSPVEVTTGADTASIALARCDGKPAPAAVEALSVLARPPSVPRPKQALAQLAKVHGADVAPGIRRIDPGLVERLATVVEHFRKGNATPAGTATRIVLVSGYRPKSAGSYHQTGRAMDFRVEGVTNEALVAFCKTLPDTGCGYYPNSLFVHMDVRAPGAGHVAWIDASRPGEPPKYVSSWPPPPEGEAGADAQPPAGTPATMPALPPATTAPERPSRGLRDGHVYFF